MGTTEELDKLKYDLYPVDDSFDKFITGVTNFETLLVNHYIEDLNNTCVRINLVHFANYY